MDTLNRPNIILSCNDLPYDTLKKCFVDKAYHLLGDAPEEVLSQHWVKLLSEFYVISEDEAIQTYIEEWSEVCFLESRIFRVTEFLKVLYEGRSEKLIGILKELGYHYSFSDRTYINDLNRVARKIGNYEARVKMLLKAIERKQENNSGEPLTYAMFDAKINQMERAFKVSIDTSRLSAQMYAIKLKDLNEYIFSLEQREQNNE